MVAAGPPVEEDHTGTGTMHAAEILHQLRERGLPVGSCWFSYESALHWLIIAMRAEWPEVLGVGSRELAETIAQIVFAGKAGFGVHGEVHFPNKPTAALSVYLDEQEAYSYRAGKVIHNCLLADRFEHGTRPVKGSFEHGWPEEIRRRVLANWQAYGYR